MTSAIAIAVKSSSNGIGDVFKVRSHTGRNGEAVEQGFCSNRPRGSCAIHAHDDTTVVADDLVRVRGDGHHAISISDVVSIDFARENATVCAGLSVSARRLVAGESAIDLQSRSDIEARRHISACCRFVESSRDPDLVATGIIQRGLKIGIGARPRQTIVRAARRMIDMAKVRLNHLKGTDVAMCVLWARGAALVGDRTSDILCCIEGCAG